MFHCSRCSQTFAAQDVYQYHRAGPRCLTPAQLRSTGLRSVQKPMREGLAPVWFRPARQQSAGPSAARVQRLTQGTPGAVLVKPAAPPQKTGKPQPLTNKPQPFKQQGLSSPAYTEQLNAAPPVHLPVDYAEKQTPPDSQHAAWPYNVHCDHCGAWFVGSGAYLKHMVTSGAIWQRCRDVTEMKQAGLLSAERFVQKDNRTRVSKRTYWHAASAGWI